MSRGFGARFLAFGLILCFIDSGAATAQREKPSSAVPAPVAEPIRLPENTQARQRLAAAHDYVKVQAWPEAMRVLQALFDANTDSFYRVSQRDRNGKPSQRWIGVRAEAEELLANLPKEGKDFYRAAYETRARKAWNAARSPCDAMALQEVVRRYRHTKAGNEALIHLGAYYFDRGETQLADACFQLSLRKPEPERLTSLMLFKATLAAQRRRSGNLAALPAWQQLVERIGADGLRIGEETYSVDKIRALLSSWPSNATDDSPLYRSDRARSGRGRGDAFLLEPQWRIDTLEGEARQWLVLARRDARRPVISAATPLAVDGKIVYRGSDGLHALDADSGRTLWHRPSLVSLASISNNSGQKVQLRNWLRLYGDDGGVLLENGVVGTLSSDGTNLYAIEDLPLPPHPSLLQNDNGGPAPLGPLRYFVGYNTLRALDAAKGTILWEIGRPAVANAKAETHPPRAVPSLEDAYFLGPPLPLGKQLFAVVEKQQEMSLVCLDAARGAVRWMQMLATARDKLSLNVVRHTQAIHLAFSEGVLVCPTNAGAILAVDPLTHGLRWVYVYAQPPKLQEDGTNEMTTAPLRSGWQGAAPIVSDGYVVYTPPDDEAIYCLRLHDGSLAWKATRGEGDRFVGCIHKGGVLVVGRSRCRMLRLDNGEVLWQRAGGEPTGQGVAVGSLYYLPLRGGALLALNMDKPEDSIRLDARAVRGDLGNLLFHRGVLWSQSATELLALMPMTAQLARLEQRLARSPSDPSLLCERGRLRLDRGDLAGAVADLRDAWTHETAPTRRAVIRDRLFDALTQWLERDFTAAEKYLDDYRELCRVSIPSSVDASHSAAVEKERQRRQTRFLVLVAAGREKQGRFAEALENYRELSRRCGELTSIPENPALRIRPDLWVRDRVTALLAHASPNQRQQIERQIRREGQALLSSFDRAALREYLALFDGIEGEEASVVAAVRLHLAQLWTTASGPHALDAELLWHDLLGDADRESASKEDQRSSFEHSARYDRALLLTRCGRLDEAFADYRRLARAAAADIVRDGKNGVELLEDIRHDKRFLPYLESPIDYWKDRKSRSLLIRHGLPLPSFRVPCAPCRHVLPDEFPRPNLAVEALLDPVREMPEWCRPLRFTVDGVRLQLIVADRASGTELYRIPLNLPSMPAFLHNGEIRFQVVDHLLVLCLGPTLLAVDMLERRVRWSRNVVEGGQALALSLSGGVVVGTTLTEPMARRGLLGPIGPSAVCIQTRSGLTALDPADGEVRWTRDDVGRETTVFGDDHYLFLVEKWGDGGVRAVRARDGVSVAMPDAGTAVVNCQRILGRHLLVFDPDANGQCKVRLYDPLIGKDLWTKFVAAGSRLLQSPQSHWLGIAEPNGTVAVVDRTRGDERARLHLDARLLKKAQKAYLLIDREQFYVALQKPLESTPTTPEFPSANFGSGLAALPVHGDLYAFRRDSGALAWTVPMPPQQLLLEQFEPLPILLLSAVSSSIQVNDNSLVTVVSTCSLDKRTGQFSYHPKTPNPFDAYHALHIDPANGVIDLIGVRQRLRHIPDVRK